LAGQASRNEFHAGHFSVKSIVLKEGSDRRTAIVVTSSFEIRNRINKYKRKSKKKQSNIMSDLIFKATTTPTTLSLKLTLA